MRRGFTAELESAERSIEGLSADAQQTLADLSAALPALTDVQLGALVADAQRLRQDARAADLRLLGMTATQAPVACDLALVLAMLQVVQYLGLIANQFELIAEQLGAIDSWDAIPAPVATALVEMASIAGAQLADATEAFRLRDPELARRTERTDDEIDRRNRGLCVAALADADVATRRERGMRAVLIARSLERIGDNAVDIARQTDRLAAGDPHGLLGPVPA